MPYSITQRIIVLPKNGEKRPDISPIAIVWQIYRCFVPKNIKIKRYGEIYLD